MKRTLLAVPALAVVSLGLGAFASRQTVTAGSSVLLAARAVADKAKKLASHVLEAAEHDLEIADGEVRVVGADAPAADAVPVAPDLEDAYLWLLHRTGAQA